MAGVFLCICARFILSCVFCEAHPGRSPTVALCGTLRKTSVGPLPAAFHGLPFMAHPAAALYDDSSMTPLWRSLYDPSTVLPSIPPPQKNPFLKNVALYFVI